MFQSSRGKMLLNNTLFDRKDMAFLYSSDLQGTTMKNPRI